MLLQGLKTMEMARAEVEQARREARRDAALQFACSLASAVAMQPEAGVTAEEIAKRSVELADALEVALGELKAGSVEDVPRVRFHPRLWERGLYEKAERLFSRASPALEAADYVLFILDLDEERKMWEISLISPGRRVGLKIAAAVVGDLGLDLGGLLVREAGKEG